MAAVLSTARARQAGRRMRELFLREVVPHLAELERRRRQHRFACVGAFAGMLAGIFAAFLLVQDLQHALVTGAIVLAIGLWLMQWVQRGYTHRVREAVMPAICGAIG